MRASGKLALGLALWLAVSPCSTARQFCEPGTTFMISCYLCLCGVTGLPTSCKPLNCQYKVPLEVKKNMLESPIRRVETTWINCEPGKAFIKGSDICMCGDDGINYLCTRLPAMRGP